MTTNTVEPTTGAKPGSGIRKQGNRPAVGALLTRYLAVLAFVAIGIFFAVAAPKFASADNFVNVLGQIALLAMVATAMTFVVRAGGIDLSVGVALDFGAMASVNLIYDGYVPWVAVVAGLLAGAAVGAANAFFITVLNVSPFLATLSTMFIGQSIQKVITEGGSPTYLLASRIPEDYSAIGKGQIAGLEFPVILAFLVLVAGFFILERMRLGRELTSIGSQSPVARISGVPIRWTTVRVYVIASTICALAGIVMGSRLSSFVPLSGDYYLLDSIGAVFIGTTLHKESRPNLPGTLLGVLIFGVLANGLNLIGLSFYWQGFARGLVLLLVLGVSVLLAKRRGRPFGKGLFKKA